MKSNTLQLSKISGNKKRTQKKTWRFTSGIDRTLIIRDDKQRSKRRATWGQAARTGKPRPELLGVQWQYRTQYIFPFTSIHLQCYRRSNRGTQLVPQNDCVSKFALTFKVKRLLKSTQNTIAISDVLPVFWGMETSRTMCWIIQVTASD